MSPEQKLAFLKRKLILTSTLSIVHTIAAWYLIEKQGKELDKMKIAFRTMSDVAGLYEKYAPGEAIAEANEKMAFAQIQIKYDE